MRSNNVYGKGLNTTRPWCLEGSPRKSVLSPRFSARSKSERRLVSKPHEDGSDIFESAQRTPRDFIFVKKDRDISNSENGSEFRENGDAHRSTATTTQVPSRTSDSPLFVGEPLGPAGSLSEAPSLLITEKGERFSMIQEDLRTDSGPSSGPGAEIRIDSADSKANTKPRSSSGFYHSKLGSLKRQFSSTMPNFNRETLLDDDSIESKDFVPELPSNTKRKSEQEQASSEAPTERPSMPMLTRVNSIRSHRRNRSITNSESREDLIIGMSPYTAARFGDLERIKKIFASHRIDEPNDLSFTCLHLAGSYGHVQCVEWLLRNGCARIEKKSSQDWTVLHLAGRGGHVECVESLLGASASVHAVDKHRRTPLHLACTGPNPECVRAMLRHDRSGVNAKDSDGWTPLHYATRCNKSDVIEALLDFGADPNLQENDGWTCMHNCARNGQVRCLQVLLNCPGSGVPLNRHRETPLHIACRKGKTKVVSTLLDHAIKHKMIAQLLSMTDMWGHTAPMVASSNYIRELLSDAAISSRVESMTQSEGDTYGSLREAKPSFASAGRRMSQLALVPARRMSQMVMRSSMRQKRPSEAPEETLTIELKPSNTCAPSSLCAVM